MLVSVHRYRSGSPLNYTDQIGVDVSIWRRLYPESDGTDNRQGGRPVFVGLAGGVAVGRVRPDPALNWEQGRVEVPEWMWLLLGAPDSGAVFDMDPVEIHDVGHLVLRPRIQGTGGDDPVAVLTAELSNGRWACLHAGMELTLDCGVWDVMRVVDVVGTEVPVGCILNQDVTVDIDSGLFPESSPTSPAQSPQSTPLTPILSGMSLFASSSALAPQPLVSSPPPSPPTLLLPSHGVMSFPGMTDISGARNRSGFVPFGGAGHRLG